MITNHRPSILQRPMRSANPHNEENMDAEYTRSQEKQRSRGARLAEAEERLRRANYASPAELLQDQQAMRDVLEQQLQEKAVQERAHKQHESDCFPANHTVRQPQDMSRPWATTTQLMSAQQEAAARQRVDAQAAEANRSLCLTRAHEAWLTEQAARAATERSLKAEDGFFNYGAASEQWIPREQRVRPASAHAQAHASRPSPYAWENPPSPQDPKQPRPSSSGPRPPYAVSLGVHATLSTKATPAQCRAPLLPQDNLPVRPAVAPRPASVSRAPYSLHESPKKTTQPRAVVASREFPWSWHA